MSEAVRTSPADVYARVSEALVTHPEIESSLLKDFKGTLKSRLGIDVRGPATLTRTDGGFRLDWGGRHYDLRDPRKVGRGELNDSELELVSGGNYVDSNGVGHYDNASVGNC